MAFRKKTLSENYRRITNPQYIIEATHPDLDKEFDDTTREELDDVMHTIANKCIDMINKSATKYDTGKNKHAAKWLLAYLVDELDDRQKLHLNIKDKPKK